MPPVRTLALLLAAHLALACDDGGEIVGGADAAADGGAADGGADASADAAVEPTCASPAVEGWDGEARRRFFGSGSEYEVSATVRWVRTERDGCVDAFQPEGTAAFRVEVATCASVVFEPATVAIARDQGRLVVDRGASPATYVVVGATTWPATRTATCGEDDAVEVDEVPVGGTWLDAAGALDGEAIAGSEGGPAHENAWSFAPAAAD